LKKKVNKRTGIEERNGEKKEKLKKSEKKTQKINSFFKFGHLVLKLERFCG